MKFLLRIIKYSLYSLVFAVIAALLFLSYIYLADTARDIGRPEFTLSTQGAERDISRVREDITGEQLQPEFKKSRESRPSILPRDWAASGEITLPAEIESGLQQLQENRRLFKEAEKEKRLAQKERKLEAEYRSYSQQRREEAEELLAQKETELHREIAAVERELTDRELEILGEVRSDIRQEYRNELLNLQVRLRTMDLSTARREEIEARIQEINQQIEHRVNLVRRRLESRLEQERLREISQLEQRYNRQARNIISELEAGLENKRADIAEKLAAMSEEKESEIREQLSRQQNRLDNQLEQLKERYFRLYGDM